MVHPKLVTTTFLALLAAAAPVRAAVCHKDSRMWCVPLGYSGDPAYQTWVDAARVIKFSLGGNNMHPVADESVCDSTNHPKPTTDAKVYTWTWARMTMTGWVAADLSLYDICKTDWFGKAASGIGCSC